MNKLNPKPRDTNEVATSFWISVSDIWHYNCNRSLKLVMNKIENIKKIAINSDPRHIAVS